MKKGPKLTYTSRANCSIIKAFEYYESAQKDLGSYFFASLEDCIISIAKNPEIYKAVYQNYRQAKITRFPYVVIYRIKTDAVVIENVFNTRQNPIKKIR